MANQQQQARTFKANRVIKISDTHYINASDFMKEVKEARARLSKFRRASAASLSTGAYLELKEAAAKDKLFISASKKVRSL